VGDKNLAHMTIKVNGRPFPITKHKSDIFTLSEILHEQQYRVECPIPDSPLMLDAGANVGISVMWFLALYRGATMHAFEPEPGNFRLLEENHGRDRNVVLNRLAVGSQTEGRSMHIGFHGANHSRVDATVGDQQEIVDVITLEQYLYQHNIERVDLMKLDVEGNELEALVGFGDRIECIQVIVGEIHERLLDEAKLYSFLEDRGFHLVRRIEFRDGRI
jgi:FkbM family methyltransferase